MSTELSKIPRGHNGGLNETNGVSRIFCRVAEPFRPTLKPLKCTLLFTDHCLITAQLYQGEKFLTGVHVFLFFSQDVDECSTGNNNCDNDAACINAVGTYSCNCGSGFTWEAKLMKCKGN